MTTENRTEIFDSYKQRAHDRAEAVERANRYIAALAEASTTLAHGLAAAYEDYVEGLRARREAMGDSVYEYYWDWMRYRAPRSAKSRQEQMTREQKQSLDESHAAMERSAEKASDAIVESAKAFANTYRES